MTYTATITSKRQLTIPSILFKKVGLSVGDKVLIKEISGKLEIKSALSLVKKLSGSVAIPNSKKNIDLDEAISKAKENYFKSRRV